MLKILRKSFNNFQKFFEKYNKKIMKKEQKEKLRLEIFSQNYP